MSVANASAANSALDSVREEKRERQVEAVENHATKEWLQQRRNFETVRVSGRPFKFQEVTTDTALEAMELAEDENLDLAEMPNLFYRVAGILAEHVEDDYLGDTTPTTYKGRETCKGAVHWVQNFKPEVIHGVFTDLTSGGLSEQERQRAESFLNE